MNETATPETDAVIAGDMGDSTHLSDMENLCRKLERERDQLCKELNEAKLWIERSNTAQYVMQVEAERDQLREWAAREIQQMPDMGGGVPYSWEKLDEQSRSMWRMRADEAASRLAAQGLERKTK